MIRLQVINPGSSCIFENVGENKTFSSETELDRFFAEEGLFLDSNKPIESLFLFAGQTQSTIKVEENNH